MTASRSVGATGGGGGGKGAGTKGVVASAMGRKGAGAKLFVVVFVVAMVMVCATCCDQRALVS